MTAQIVRKATQNRRKRKNMKQILKKIEALTYIDSRQLGPAEAVLPPSCLGSRGKARTHIIGVL